MTIRMFIGTSSNGEDAEAEMVYEYTLRKNCSEDLEITWMRQDNKSDSWWGGWDTQHWSTPFSGFRWAIPEVCEFAGRAIYTDVDMLNFRDIAELNNVDMEGKPFAARRGQRFGGHEFCVMVIDCERAKDLLIPVRRMKSQPHSHHRYIHMFSGKEHYVDDLDPRWNCLDGENYDPKDIWHLHYTNMATQPWRPGWYTGPLQDHPRQDLCVLWHNLVREAYEQGCVPPTNCAIENDPVEYNIIGQ